MTIPRCLTIPGLATLLLSSSTVAAQTRPQPPWTRGATCYEVFVRSFADSNGDGIGDLNGLTAKLDYINDGNPRSTHSLGARCIWLMPVMEAPSYHGYDQSDFYAVEKDYGTKRDFKRFTAAAHKRGIKVLVDMVLNHSSNQHPWFQAALRDTASPYRKYYRFSPTKPDEKGPWGQNVWVKSPVRDEYYYAVFDRSQPDLNYETPAVRAEANKIARYWLKEMGVDGFRLDAVQYLMEDHGEKAGSPGTHTLLHDYASYVRSVQPNTYTVGEVYADIKTMLSYYPDQLDSYFAFEVADSIISAARTGSARGVLAPVLRLQGAEPSWRFSPFLRNHDQPRTRSELGGDMAKSRIAAFLLLTMPGLPFVYYGEEIGMIGVKPDERLRTPMQWTASAGAGFTHGTPWERLQDDSMTTTVDAEERDSSSLLHEYRRLIHLRASNSALGNGQLVPLATNSDAVAAYLRSDGTHVVLVVANLGSSAADSVTLSSGSGALRPGRWTARSLFGGLLAPALGVGADGSMQSGYMLPALAPQSGYLFELAAAPFTKTR